MLIRYPDGYMNIYGYRYESGIQDRGLKWAYKHKFGSFQDIQLMFTAMVIKEVSVDKRTKERYSDF